MGEVLDVIVAVVAVKGLPHTTAIGLTVAEAERRLIEKLRDDENIAALVDRARAAAPRGSEIDYFNREVFFDLLRSSEDFTYGWVKDKFQLD